MKNKVSKGLMFGTFVLVLAAAFLFSSKVGNDLISSVDVSGADVNGKSYNEAAYDLDVKYLSLLEDTVLVKFGDEEFETNLRALGVDFDTYKTLELVYEAAADRSLLSSLTASVLDSDDELEVDTVFEIDRGQMEKEILSFVPLANSPSDAEVVVDEGVVVTANEAGFYLDFDDVYDQMFNALVELELPSIDLKKRLYSAAQLAEDAEILASILAREIVFRPVDSEELDYSKIVKVQSDWVSVEGGNVEFDKEAIEAYVLEEIALEVEVKPTDAIINSFSADADYADVSAVARHGRSLDLETTVHRVVVASSGRYGGDNPVLMEFYSALAGVKNESGVDLGAMVLLGQGRSNFSGSPAGRDFNVRKGLNEKFNNVLLAPGETFSYNALLGPVTHRAGWQDSLAIFGGGKLVPVPGGGLCQVSTTMYRALVNSGLNIIDKSNHSLYVHYYKAYGDGLDAAIYPGSKDLRFINDTPSYLLIQAYAGGDDGFINVYGTPDGRSVALDGPFYAGQVPDEFKGRVNPRSNQIMWIQQITRPNGEVEEKILTSTYRSAVR
ncbi:VanW family protein [Candidatus Gracilibacteria bacterium]|nr:VanW family protein [Candidatus Gracilibacteria bacterium]